MPITEAATPHARAWKDCLAVLMVLLVICCLWIAVIALLDPAFSVADPQQNNWSIAFRNAIPPTLLTLLLWTSTRRLLLSTWITVLILSALYAANALKLEHLETPLLPTDFRVIGNNFGGGLLLHYLPSAPRDIIASVVAALVLIGLCLEPPSAWLRAWRRGAFALVSIVLGASLLAGVSPWRELYPRSLLEFQSWSPIHSMEHAGLIAGLLRYHWEFSGPAPEPDPQLASDLLSRYRETWSTAAPATDALPDIVVVQSESFFDPARLNGIEAGATLQNYRALAARSVHGDLRVPAYGGGTIRTEFEVLSGLSMRYFPQDEYPYFRLADRPLRGLTSILNARGYHTVAIHPNDPAFWNRKSALQSMGFAEFRSISDFDRAQRDGWFISDSELTQSVLRQLPDEGPPRFVFAISMGAHGPYDETPINDRARRDAIAVPAELKPSRATRLRTYLYLLENADNALGELAAALERRPRRTLLLFYGDHLPALPKTYAQLGFRDGASPNAQAVPWLLFDNARPDSGGQRVDSASFFLPGQLLHAANIDDDPYFRVTEAVRAKTRFEGAFKPAEDAGLSALMPLRQRDQEQALIQTLLDEPAQLSIGSRE